MPPRAALPRDYRAPAPGDGAGPAPRLEELVIDLQYNTMQEYIDAQVDDLLQGMEDEADGDFLYIARWDHNNEAHYGPNLPQVDRRAVRAIVGRLPSKVIQEIYNMQPGDVAGEAEMHPQWRFIVYRVPIRGPAAGGPAVNWRAGSIRGSMGKVNNCVVRQISDFVTYYVSSGTRRAYMWTDDGAKKGLSAAESNYDADSMQLLYQDKTYRAIRAGVSEFLKGRGIPHTEKFGFEVRDLCELASLCNVRIVVWVTCGRIRIVRWDTDDVNGASKDRRYQFHFDMTCTQHLELVDVAQRSDAYTIPYEKSIMYWTDEEFDKVVKGDPSGVSEEDKRIYSVVRHSKRWPLPSQVASYRYSNLILQSGGFVYKHKSYIDWLESIDADPLDTGTSYWMSIHDVHSDRLIQMYRERNAVPLCQKRTPRLFNAARWADKTVVHCSYPVPEGSDLWEVDGFKWYLSNFSLVKDFPYFHGYPMRSCWSEYSGVDNTTTYDPSSGTFVSASKVMGNGPGMTPFTFKHGRYAIFQITSLDISGCSPAFVKHLERDNIYTGVPDKHSCFVASPVLHFLQDQGVVWSAKRVWVTFATASDWVPPGPEGDQLRSDMLQEKTYAVVMGKMMAGRDPVWSSTFITQDEETAESLCDWYSSAFVYGDPNVFFDGIRRDVNPKSVIYGEDGNAEITTDISGSMMLQGGLYRRCIAEGEGIQPHTPYWVSTHHDAYGSGKSWCHISGAQHAYCFVRLYQAVVRLEPERVAGFSLDCIKCIDDPTRDLASFISEDYQDGSFHPPVRSVCVNQIRSKHLLTDLYTPAGYMNGICEDVDKPVWGPYHDQFEQFNFVSGAAGSGKTTRHFAKFPGEDRRIDPETVVYATMTNYLSVYMRDKLGVRCHTSFKAFYRTVGDEDRVVSPEHRYKSQCTDREARSLLDGAASVFVDEASMIDSAKMKDIFLVCKENHLQLFVTGDFDSERFYQLAPVHSEESAFFNMVNDIQATAGFEGRVRWLPVMPVMRQRGDPELDALLQEVRRVHSSTLSWAALSESPLFRRTTYSEMIRTIDPSKDLVAAPWHSTISVLTSGVLDHMRDSDELILRCNVEAPRRVKDGMPDCVKRIGIGQGPDSDKMLYKGATAKVTKTELMQLRGTEWMRQGFPYKAESGHGRGNMVNPMIGATVFNLQGLTLSEDGTLYLLVWTQGAREWLDPSQPNMVYVVASRIRRREQLVFVYM